MRLALPLVFVAASIAFPVSPGLAAGMTMALPDCADKPVVRPASVTLACGDGNFYVQNLKWTGWGESFAAAQGTGRVNDCEPNCAGGQFHNYPVLLVAEGKQRCPNGQPAYAQVVYAFVGRSPYNSGSVEDATIRFPCKPM